MMLLSRAAQVLGGRLIGNDIEFSAISTDSRAISAGDLFMALQGEKFDGSRFVAYEASTQYLRSSGQQHHALASSCHACRLAFATSISLNGYLTPFIS